MNWKNYDLAELEHIAYKKGDIQGAEIIQDLIDTKKALEDLIEKGEKLDQSLLNEQADAPQWLEKGAFVYWAHCVDLENFREALSDANGALNN